MAKEQAQHPQANQSNRKRVADMPPAERKEFFESRKKEKREKAERDDTRVVFNRTLDATYMSQFIERLDFIMDKCRKSLGYSKQITIDNFTNVLEMNNAIMGLINLFCAKTSRITNLTYRPPRGHIDLTKQGNLKKAAEMLRNVQVLVSQELEEIEARLEKIEAEENKKAREVAEKKAAKQPKAAKPAVADEAQEAA